MSKNVVLILLALLNGLLIYKVYRDQAAFEQLNGRREYNSQFYEFNDEYYLLNPTTHLYNEIIFPTIQPDIKSNGEYTLISIFDGSGCEPCIKTEVNLLNNFNNLFPNHLFVILVSKEKNIWLN
ncbi:MAG: hypothetical protein K9N07_11700 [Candidatus Cloacimonetes bacterium]|nr:hypothetical protein [Candidatus Cloacimonadota bacterium]